MEDINKLLKKRGQLTRSLLNYREMLPGSYVERYLTCGQPNCTCKSEGRLHKAYYLSYRSKGKTIGKSIPKRHAAEVKRLVQLKKEFNAIVEEIHKINVEILLENLKKKGGEK